MSYDTRTVGTEPSVLRQLDAAVVERIMGLGVRRQLEAGDVLFFKGDEGNALYRVINGQIQISATAPTGREVILTVMTQGNVFGEIALLDGMPRTADAIARVPTELVMIRRCDFIALLEREPRIAVSLLKLLCERVRRVNEQVEDFAFLDLSGRLAKQLLTMARLHGDVLSDGVRVRLQPSQDELGAVLGVSRVSINKHLRRWRENGWLDLNRGQVLIRDFEALHGLVDAGNSACTESRTQIGQN